MPDVNEDFVAIAQQEGWYSEDLMRRIAEAGHINFPEVPARWQRVFVTANHIKPEWHIRMQAAFQEYNDSAISKTCNFANDATEAYVEEIYRQAYRLGCKGVTVYRDGSRDTQVLSTGATAKKVKAGGGRDRSRERCRLGAARRHADLHGEIAELRAENERLRRAVHELEAENLQRRQKRSRPELLRGTTRRLETPLGTLYVTITEDDRGQPFEVFMSLGKAGGALMADVEALGRLISLALRSGIPMTGDLPPAPRHQLRPRHRPRCQQGALGAGRGGHRDRAVDAGQAGRAAGAAAGPGRRRGRRRRWCSR